MRALIVVAAAVGCGGEDLVEPLRSTPRVVSASSSSSNAYNAMSAVIESTAEGADSARVITVGENFADTTPFTRVTGGSDTIVALGLRPEATYRSGRGGRAARHNPVRHNLFQHEPIARPHCSG